MEYADVVITNAVILDYTGIYKADIGIRDGKIAGIGKAGNPLVMDKVDIVIGAGTEIIAGEGMIVTAGGIDTHVHFINPEQVRTALTVRTYYLNWRRNRSCCRIKSDNGNTW